MGNGRILHAYGVDLGGAVTWRWLDPSGYDLTP